MHSGTTVPLQRADPRAVYKYGCFYPRCEAAIEKALWKTTVGLHLFGAHLWHFHFHYSHIVRVIAREPPAIWCIIAQKWCQEAGKACIQCLGITFSSLCRRLFAFCSSRYPNSIRRVKLFGGVSQHCLPAKHSENGFLLPICMLFIKGGFGMHLSKLQLV